jgi:hypothetical protein
MKYFVFKNEKENEIMQRLITDGKCMIINTEMDVTVMDSHPDGKANRALPQEFFKRRTAYVVQNSKNPATVKQEEAKHNINTSSTGGSTQPNYHYLMQDRQKKQQA